MVKALSNSPDPTRRGRMRGLVQITSHARRSVRRLMKVDPNTDQGMADSKLLVGQNGVTGRSGASPIRRVLGRAESTRTATGTGLKRIRNRSANTRLKRR